MPAFAGNFMSILSFTFAGARIIMKMAFLKPEKDVIS